MDGVVKPAAATPTPALRASAAYDRLRTSFTAGRCVVLDGGVATQIEHQHGPADEALWGVEALASAPDEVAAVHRGYVEAGADVITTNTWGLMTAVGGFPGLTGLGGPPISWMELARRGMSVARQGIREGDAEDRCAVAFSLNADIDAPDGEEVAALLLRALAGDPPDLLLVETLSVVRPSLFAVVETLVRGGVPVWLSFRRCREGLCGVYGQHWGGPEGDAFGRAARRFEELGVEALLVNCIPPDHVPGMVSHLRDFTDLPLGVYPNLGYLTNDGWRSEAGVGGAEYAEMALRWRAEGAQIVGGCCGTRPPHIRAAATALAGTRPGTERVSAAGATPPGTQHGEAGALRATDRRGRPLLPLPFPVIEGDGRSAVPLDGTFLMWKRLFEERLGTGQRCLDIGSGAGLQTVQLALNDAEHVHAIDVDPSAVATTLDNAFRNGVADRVTAAVADLFPWVPEERYELVVANLPQTPADPLGQLVSHRPADFWGRGLIDQVIAKLPDALAQEGMALLTISSLVSIRRTAAVLAAQGLQGEVVDWDVRPAAWTEGDEHIARVEQLSDGFRLRFGPHAAAACYLLEIRPASEPHGEPGTRPWRARR